MTIITIYLVDTIEGLSVITPSSHVRFSLLYVIAHHDGFRDQDHPRTQCGYSQILSSPWAANTGHDLTCPVNDLPGTEWHEN